MGVHHLEREPGITEPWLSVWRASLKQLKEQGSWRVSQRPLLDEYVLALRAAENARESGESAVAWDKHAKRALALADALGLTPKAQKVLATKLEEGADGGDGDPFEALDELAPRRRAK